MNTDMDQLVYFISQESDVGYNTGGIPSKCPAVDCEERIPAGAVDKRLCDMFKKYQAAVKRDNADSDAAIQQATMICIYITTIKKCWRAKRKQRGMDSLRLILGQYWNVSLQ